MHPSEDLINRFYRAFQRREHAAMAACYAPNVEFQDAVFSLKQWRAGAMWRMLCERGADLRVEFWDVRADDVAGSAHWEAWYTFSATGRKVHNVIQAEFVFNQRLIVRHTDRFDLYRWASQALGMKGLLLGWTPLVQRAIRTSAARTLDSFIAKEGLGPTA